MANPFHTKVVGVTKLNRNGSDRQRIIRRCRVGEFLDLIPEPDNPYDESAVKVCRMTGEQLGYLAAGIAAQLHGQIARGRHIDAEISSLTGGGRFSGKARGVNILITKQ